MTARNLSVILACALIACDAKQERQPAETSAKHSAVTEFAAKLQTFETTKFSGAIYSEIRSDISHSPSVTAPYTAKITLKKHVSDGAGTAVYELTISAAFRENAWHYEKCVGTVSTRGETIKIDEGAFDISAAYDVVSSMKLKHADKRYPASK